MAEERTAGKAAPAKPVKKVKKPAPEPQETAGTPVTAPEEAKASPKPAPKTTRAPKPAVTKKPTPKKKPAAKPAPGKRAGKRAGKKVEEKPEKEAKPARKVPKKKEEEEEEVEHEARAKPELAAAVLVALRLRREASSRRPAFYRQEWFRYKKLGRKWRKPQGGQSKLRRHFGYRPNVVSIGYRGPKAARGLHPSGFQEVLVRSPSELKGVDPKRQAVRIAGGVGGRKRDAIQKEAEGMGLRVLNRREA